MNRLQQPPDGESLTAILHMLPKADVTPAAFVLATKDPSGCRNISTAYRVCDGGCSYFGEVLTQPPDLRPRLPGLITGTQVIYFDQNACGGECS